VLVRFSEVVEADCAIAAPVRRAVAMTRAIFRIRMTCLLSSMLFRTDQADGGRKNFLLPLGVLHPAVGIALRGGDNEVQLHYTRRVDLMSMKRVTCCCESSRSCVWLRADNFCYNEIPLCHRNGASEGHRGPNATFSSSYSGESSNLPDLLVALIHCSLPARICRDLGLY